MEDALVLSSSRLNPGFRASDVHPWYLFPTLLTLS